MTSSSEIAIILLPFPALEGLPTGKIRLSPRTTVRKLIQKTKIKKQDYRHFLIVVNNKRESLDYLIQEGDEVKIFSSLAGG